MASGAAPAAPAASAASGAASGTASDRSDENARRLTRYAAIAAFIVLYSLVAAIARPLTIGSTFTVLLPGVAIVAWGIRRTPGKIVKASRKTVAVWWGLLLVFCGWEIVAFVWGNDPDHPTLSLLADPMLSTYPGRLFGYALWLGTGAWLVSR